MKKVIFVVFFLFSALAVIVLLRTSFLKGQNFTEKGNPNLEGSKESGCQRIVSLAPSATEILFSLGLGDKVVGVTRFCNYPPEAQGKIKVGGFYDPNYEVILSLKPDLVVLLNEHEKPREYLSSLNIDLLVLDHRSLDGILDSITKIGMACERGEEARGIVEDLSRRIEVVRSKTKDLPSPRVMVSIGRSVGELKNIYIAGQDGFYNEMLNLAGGRNIYTDNRIKFPLLSKEAIVRLNPDIIIDLVAGVEGEKPAIADWEKFREVNAVKNKRVYLLTEDYMVIPGPRFILIIEKLARIIHPEIDW